MRCHLFALFLHWLLKAILPLLQLPSSKTHVKDATGEPIIGATIRIEGKTGADEIKQMMTDFRANPPQELGGSKVVTWKDYQSLEVKHADGSVEKLDMPATSNVLQWFCDDNTKVSVRPSGTEPKIKFYIEVKDPSFKCAGCYNRCTAAAMDKIEAIKKSLKLD